MARKRQRKCKTIYSVVWDKWAYQHGNNKYIGKRVPASLLGRQHFDNKKDAEIFKNILEAHDFSGMKNPRINTLRDCRIR